MLTESAAISAPVQNARRAFALDALRGISILMMVASSLVPHGLPGWMYHAQDAPPTHATNYSIPGITWVDLVFPFFLFSMGAAIPLALSRRLEKGVPLKTLVSGILQRGALLVFFALYVRHISPWNMQRTPDRVTAALALLGFALVFPVLARLPQTWGKRAQLGVRLAGWVAIIIFLAFLSARGYADGTGFSRLRSDVIILVLANMAVGSSLIWLATRNNLLMRLSVMGAVFALRLSASVPGWPKTVWGWAPEPVAWFYRMEYWKYLLVVIPGTIAGDMLLEWMRSRKDDASSPGWRPWRMAALAGILSGIVLVMLVGLHGPRPADPAVVATGQFARWTVEATLAGALMGAAACGLTRLPGTTTERLLAGCVRWGLYWMAIGLILEPFEGGIKKSHTTFSYFFLPAGLALFVLAAFIILIDVFGRKRWFGLLIANGQNPMIAYIGWANLIFPVLAITGLGDRLQALTPTPWLGVLRGGLITLALALVVAGFTRGKVFLRT